MAIRKKAKIVKKVKVFLKKKPAKRKMVLKRKSVVSKRKTIFKRKAKPILMNAYQGYCFWVCDRKVLKNLTELKTALKRMSDNTFVYHVNKNKNDFAKWVNDVLKEKVLAKALQKIKTRKLFLKKIEIALKKYK